MKTPVPTCYCCGEPLSQLSFPNLSRPLCSECLELERAYFGSEASYPLLAEVAV